MQTVSANFTAKAAANYAPIFLFELPQAGLYYASRAFGLSRRWYAGEGLFAGYGYIAGSVRPGFDSDTIASGGIGSVSMALGDRNEARIGNSRMRLLNQDNLAGSLPATEVDAGPFRLLLGFKGMAYQDFMLLMRGVVDTYDFGWNHFELTLLDDSFQVYRDLSTPLWHYFPACPRDNRRKAIPILIGRNTDVTCIQVETDARGTLAFGLATTDSKCYLVEADAPFTPTGTVNLGTETGVTYTARDTVTINGQSYLELSGLTRGAPVVQSAGAAVVRTGVDYRFLVGYEVGSVDVVRVDDVVQSSGFTITLSSDEADHPVTIVDFDSDPGGVVTVDCDGLNIDADAAISNGDFEAGDTSGWTAVAPATFTADTTTPQEGTYKAVLTGSEDSDEVCYQDFATTPGRQYTLIFHFRDTMGDTNLISNGDFETGDLTGWTELSDDTDYGGQANVTDGTFWGRSQILTTSIINDPDQWGAGKSNFTPRYGATWQQAKFVNTFWRHYIYADVTTVIGTWYTFWVEANFTYLLNINYYTKVGGEYQLQTGTLMAFPGAGIGVPADPDSIYPVQNFGLKSADIESGYGAGGWKTYPQLEHGDAAWQFQATGTTTRITLSCWCQSSIPASAPGLDFDNATLVETLAPSLSTTTMKLGVPTDDDAIVSEVLHRAYGWTKVVKTFQATGPVTRLTFASQWQTISTPTHLDNIYLEDAGRNPADAIAYVIDNYLPSKRRDVASFEAAYAALAGWQFGAYIPQPGDAKQLLERMASQCGSRLFTDNQGAIKLIPWQYAPAVQHHLTADNIIEGSLAVRASPQDLLASEIYVWWGLRAGATEGSEESYQHVAYVTPEETTHETLALNNQALFVTERYHTERRLNIYADMIRDSETAHRLLAHLTFKHMRRQQDIQCRTWYDAAPLEVSDVVYMSHPRVYEQRPWICEVLRRQVQANGEVALALRTIRLAGLHEEWEPTFTMIPRETIPTETWELALETALRLEYGPETWEPSYTVTPSLEKAEDWELVLMTSTVAGAGAVSGDLTVV